MHSDALMLDLFWEPAVGDLVMLRAHARTGVGPFDEHPLKVKKATDMDGVRLFHCETTGPTTGRTLSTGRVVRSHPCWTTFATAEELLPVTPNAELRGRR